MIITDKESEEVQTVEYTNVFDQSPLSDEPPPEYKDISSPTNSSLQPPPSPPQPLPLTIPKPTNNISLSQLNDRIKGTWTIDPTLSFSSALLRSPSENLFLSTVNGKIEAEVVLLGSKSEEVGNRKAKIRMQSFNGRIVSKIYDPPQPGLYPYATSSPRPKIQLSLQTTNGTVTLFLPRSFRGTIQINTRRPAKFSAGVQAAMRVLSIGAGSVQRVFLGEWVEGEGEIVEAMDQYNVGSGAGGTVMTLGYVGLNANVNMMGVSPHGFLPGIEGVGGESATWPGEGWKGDEVDIHIQNGALNIYYLDEDVTGGLSNKVGVQNLSSGRGFWSRLFGI